MCTPLTPKEYSLLMNCQAKCEKILRDPYLVAHTNVQYVYDLTMETIKSETEPAMIELYQIPGILPASI